MNTARVTRTADKERPRPRVMYRLVVSAPVTTPSPPGRQMTPATDDVSHPRPPMSRGHSLMSASVPRHWTPVREKYEVAGPNNPSVVKLEAPAKPRLLQMT